MVLLHMQCKKHLLWINNSPQPESSCVLWVLQESAGVTSDLLIVRWSYDSTAFVHLSVIWWINSTLLTDISLDVCSLFNLLANKSLSCFCVFLFFSVFFFSFMSLGWCWILIGGGAQLDLWHRPAAQLNGPNPGCFRMAAPPSSALLK